MGKIVELEGPVGHLGWGWGISGRQWSKTQEPYFGDGDGTHGVGPQGCKRKAETAS